MKSIIITTLSLYFVLSLSCQKFPTSPKGHQAMISVMGHFTGLPKLAVVNKSAGTALDASLVSQVAAIFGMGGFMVSNVNDGSFNVIVPDRQPAALLFMDSVGRNLGYLSLDSGMESLPLNKADDSVTSINLQALTATGNIVSPGHNPIGTEILMTASDITSYIFSNGSLGSVVKAPDVDGDGIVDVATGVMYGYLMRYDITGGNFETGLTPAVADPISIKSYVLEIKVTSSNTNFPDTIYFNGPSGSGIESAQSWLKQPFGANGRIDGCSYCAPAVQNPTIPPAGTYLVTFNTKTLTFNLPSQAEITRCLALPVPTVELNSNGTIHKITWEYRLSDGSATIDPKALILSVRMSVYSNMASGQPAVQMYDTPNLPPEITEHVLSNQSIPWNNTNCISAGVEDVFGGQFLIQWNRP